MKYTDTTRTEKKETKETVLTNYLCGNRGWVNVHYTFKTLNNICPVKEVKYLGKCIVDGDMFAVTFWNDEISIYNGIKGDEFN